MTHSALIALLPYAILAATPVVVMLGIALRRSHVLAVGLTLLGLVATLAATLAAAAQSPQSVTALLIVDPFALLYLGLIVPATAFVALLAAGYLEPQTVPREEFYVLLLTGALGSAVLGAASHFASFFLGLEVLGVSLYGLVAYHRDRALSLEAAMKYLVLAGTSSAFLLFGMALMYSQTGALALPALATTSALGHGGALAYTAGALLLLVGIGFKLGVVPFHLWAPDIYQGAPAPVSAFIATVSKGAVFAVLIRWFLASDLAADPSLALVFSCIAAASMLAGNLLALLQTSLKRLLGYSSIAHMGYLLVALIAGGELGASAATFYLAAYFVTMLAAFGVVAALSDGESDADALADVTGLAWRRPGLAAVLTAALLSLAGIPLTAGFMGKAYLLAGGAATSHWTLLLVLAIASAIGVYYYLRVVMAIFSHAPQASELRAIPPASLPAGIALAVLLLLVLWLGVWPGPAMSAVAALIAGWF